MERPLRRDSNKSGEWSLAVISRELSDKLTYPMLRWSFGMSPDSLEGRVIAWPFRHGAFTFRIIGEEEQLTFYEDKFEDLLEKIDEQGWGEPPHIDEVFQDMQESSQKLASTRGEPIEQQILDNLRIKWKRFIAETEAHQVSKTRSTRAFWDDLLGDIDMDLSKPPK